mgnify:FL=1
MTITVTFNDQHSVLFTTRFDGNPTESQFEIAGRELVAVASHLRGLRLQEQLKTAKAEPVQAPAGTDKTPIGPPAKILEYKKPS